MLNSIEDACALADSFVLDDSANLLRALMRHSSVPAKDEKPPELQKLGIELRLKAKEKEGLYFMGEKYRFYNPLDVADMIDFISLNYKQSPALNIEKIENSLFSRILNNADPRNYITIVCVDYGDEKAANSKK